MPSSMTQRMARWLSAAGRHLRPGFRTRLALTLTISMCLGASLGYLAMTRLQREGIIEQARETQGAHAEDLEAVAHGRSRAELHRHVRQVLHAASHRDGVVATLLIDRDFKIAYAHDRRLIGTRHRDEHVIAAFRNRARRQAITNLSNEFEIITPVELGGERFAFETEYADDYLSAEVGKVQREVAVIALVALIGGCLLFYLFGGRSLIRSHRRALERATHDGLTDLANQRAFQKEFADAVAIAHRHGEPLALAMIDIDDFKYLNDRHGHRHGDEVLLRVSGVLADGRAGDRAFRVGGDEFAVLLTRTDLDGARQAVSRLQQRFADAQVTTSTGLSEIWPGEEASTLREEADAALYEAKRQGGNRLIVYEDIRDSVSITTSAKIEALRRLLEEKDLTVAFQPIWNLDGGSLLGVEALARPAPKYGFDGPAEAFDIAEQVGRVHELDMVCVQKILEHAPQLPPGALLFVNIAPRTLDLDARGDDWLVNAVREAHMATSQVVIEVTERFGARRASVVKSLERLTAAGLRLALDDVGAGNAGLEMLRSVDVDFVKIDRSIIAAAEHERGARAVLVAMATFANETGSYVIAEGIENQEALGFVQRLATNRSVSRPRIHGGQGYGLGRPQPAMPPARNDSIGPGEPADELLAASFAR
jgi:diguanylate cyclase (GGDEF)-like protein